MISWIPFICNSSIDTWQTQQAKWNLLTYQGTHNNKLKTRNRFSCNQVYGHRNLAPATPESQHPGKERAKFLAKLTIKLHTNRINYLVGRVVAQRHRQIEEAKWICVLCVPGPINKQQIFYANFQFNTALNALTHTCTAHTTTPSEINVNSLGRTNNTCVRMCGLKRPINRMRFNGTQQHFVVIFIIYTDTERMAHLNVIWLRGIAGRRDRDGFCTIEFEIIGRNLFVWWPRHFIGVKINVLIRYFQQIQLFDKLLSSLQTYRDEKAWSISINHRLRYSLTQVNYDLSKSKSVWLPAFEPEKLFRSS